MNYYIEVLKKYAEFSGRARRKEYWFFYLFNIIASLILMFIDTLTNTFNPDIGIGTLGFIYGIAVIIPSIAVSIRRLHDTSRSGWWLLLLLIPLIGAIVVLIFMVLDSTPGDNEYGPNPKHSETVA